MRTVVRPGMFFETTELISGERYDAIVVLSERTIDPGGAITLTGSPALGFVVHDLVRCETSFWPVNDVDDPTVEEIEASGFWRKIPR